MRTNCTKPCSMYQFKKSILSVLVLSIMVIVSSFSPKPPSLAISPLSAYGEEWNNAKYAVCNTAKNAKYMSASEKELIYILNLARINPKLFCNTVVAKYPTISNKGYIKNSDYYTSLVDTMSKLQPLKILAPDSLCYVSAQCHAYNSGLTGYTGHTRDTDKCEQLKHFYGECCDYGYSNPLDIIMALLIDDGVASLGHRYICLGNYTAIGVSIQPHKTYGTNAVMDFYY
jgi:hypothetical protein